MNETEEPIPVACTIGAGEVDERIAVFGRLRDELIEVDRADDGGLRLRFPSTPSNDAEVRRFVTDEQRCCAFWSFELAPADDELVLRWGGPPTARHLLDELHDYFTGAGPLTLL